MPGVGISIGLTRLISRLLKANVIKPLPPTPAQVVVLNVEEKLIPVYLSVSQQLRKSGLNVITNFETRSLGKQFQQAEKRKIPFCVVIGEKEATNNMAGLKDIRTREQIEVSMDELAAVICQRL